MEDDLEDHQRGRSGGRRGLSRSQKSQTSSEFYTRHLGKRELKSQCNFMFLLLAEPAFRRLCGLAPLRAYSFFWKLESYFFHAKTQSRKGVAVISRPPRWTGRFIFFSLRRKGKEYLSTNSINSR